MAVRKKQTLWVTFWVALVAMPFVIYLMTLGHVFLPFNWSSDFKREKIETRSYARFIIPNPGNSFDVKLSAFKWQIVYPGRARLLATGIRLQAAFSQKDVRFQQVLEDMGYPFPSGSYARGGQELSSFEISNYPSVLNRIERDLKLQPDSSVVEK